MADLTDDEQVQAMYHVAQEVSWYMDRIRETLERYRLAMPRLTVILRDPEHSKMTLCCTNEPHEDLPLMYQQVLGTGLKEGNPNETDTDSYPSG
jgi:hypothetical protein